jgi:putative hydrolase of the HAD superfamily
LSGPRSSHIRAVVFDYGDVLSGPRDPAKIERLRELTGLPRDDFAAAYAHNRLRLDRLTMTAHAYWQDIVSRGPRVPTAELIDALIAADVDCCVRLDPAMTAWVERLRSAGVRCAILSNMPRELLAGLRQAHPDWLALFDVAVFSCEAGCVKPEPLIYRRLIDVTGLAPAEMLFVDDVERNLLPAHQIGFETLRYCGVEPLREAVAARYDLPLP